MKTKEDFIANYAVLTGVNEEKITEFAERRGISALIVEADELCTTEVQRNKFLALQQVIKLSGAIKNHGNVIRSPEDVRNYIFAQIKDISARETVFALYLGKDNQVLDYTMFSGLTSTSILEISEILKHAIRLKSKNLILSHNHPSGDVSPSSHDIDSTERMAAAASIYGINLIDHLIVSGNYAPRYYSMAKNYRIDNLTGFEKLAENASLETEEKVRRFDELSEMEKSYVLSFSKLICQDAMSLQDAINTFGYEAFMHSPEFFMQNEKEAKRYEALAGLFNQQTQLEEERPLLNEPPLAASFVASKMGQEDRECVFVLCLDVKNKLKDYVVLDGYLDDANFPRSDAFKNAIMTKSQSVIFVQVTAKTVGEINFFKAEGAMNALGKSLGIKVLDHIQINPKSKIAYSHSRADQFQMPDISVKETQKHYDSEPRFDWDAIQKMAPNSAVAQELLQNPNYASRIKINQAALIQDRLLEIILQFKTAEPLSEEQAMDLLSDYKNQIQSLQEEGNAGLVLDLVFEEAYTTLRSEPKTTKEDSKAMKTPNNSEKAATKKEKLDRLFSKIDEGVKEVFSSEHYINTLKFFSQFHRYSWRNALLISQQYPKATLVAGFSAWKDKFKRSVNKGEKGIQILGCRAVKVAASESGERGEANDIGETKEERTYLAFFPTYVWDVSQTSGEPLPSLAQPLVGDKEDYQAVLKALIAAAPCEVTFDSFGQDEGNGYYQLARGSLEAKIFIRDNMSEKQTIKTLVHELAHATLHADNSTKIDRMTREVQAESVAFIVSEHLGIDSSAYSFPYIASWSHGKELPELKASLEEIKTASSGIIFAYDKERENGLVHDKSMQQNLQGDAR